MAPLSEEPAVERISYPSADGSSTVCARIWRPASVTADPRGVVQIVHGMSEYIGRYDAFARFLAEQGFLVCGEDHVGHGETAPSESDLGHIPVRGGEDVLLSDVHALRERVMSLVDPSTPYILFGHSLGSFIVRVYLTRCGHGVSAAILSGTGQQSRALTLAGRALPRLIALVRGERHRSPLAHALGAGAYSKAITDARTEFDWLSHDRGVVDAYIADPRCGMMFTVGGYAAVADLADDSQRMGLARRIPRDIPMLLIGGAEDPVGDLGRGVSRAAGEYREAGVSDIEVKLYPGTRHEILNESVAREATDDILSWLDRHGL